MTVQRSPDDRQRPRLLVTGASGMLGYWICRLARGDWSVWGVHCRNPIRISGVKAIQADLTLPSKRQMLFDRIGPGAVIHAAAISQPALCEDDPMVTQGINLEVPPSLAGICAERAVPFVFTSTDLVFDGLNPPYDENSAVSPVCVYGRQKAFAERAVMERYPGALVCRMPLMFGLGPRNADNFSLRMLLAIQQGRPIKLFTDEFRTPVDFQSAAQGLLKFIGRRKGLLHLGGRTRVSRYALGLLMAEQLKISPDMLQPMTLDAISMATARSPDCSLISEAAYDMGYDPLSLPTAVQRIVSRFNAISNSKE